MAYRIGFGVDFHQLAEGRELKIGGVSIPHDKGAVGHSDADVLLHAICDALLGAACLGDIGVHFRIQTSNIKILTVPCCSKKPWRLYKKRITGW